MQLVFVQIALRAFGQGRVMESLHVPVTLQLYFKGDPFIAGDPWAHDRFTNTIELEQDGELRRGGFDIVLARGFG